MDTRKVNNYVKYKNEPKKKEEKRDLKKIDIPFEFYIDAKLFKSPRRLLQEQRINASKIKVIVSVDSCVIL